MRGIGAARKIPKVVIINVNLTADARVDRSSIIGARTCELEPLDTNGGTVLSAETVSIGRYVDYAVGWRCRITGENNGGRAALPYKGSVARNAGTISAVRNTNCHHVSIKVVILLKKTPSALQS